MPLYSDVCECNCGNNGHRGVCTRKATATVYLRIRGNVTQLPMCWPCAQELQRSEPETFVRAIPDE